MVGGSLLVFSVHLHGTLAANAQGFFKLPVAATLKEVQGAASNASSANMDFGPSTDADGIIDGVDIGDSGAVVTLDRDDWNGVLYTDAANIENLFYPEDTIFNWSLDFDGNGGTAAQNVSLHFIFEV